MSTHCNQSTVIFKLHGTCSGHVATYSGRQTNSYCHSYHNGLCHGCHGCNGCNGVSWWGLLPQPLRDAIAGTRCYGSEAPIEDTPNSLSYESTAPSIQRAVIQLEAITAQRWRRMSPDADTDHRNFRGTIRVWSPKRLVAMVLRWRCDGCLGCDGAWWCMVVHVAGLFNCSCSGSRKAHTDQALTLQNASQIRCVDARIDTSTLEMGWIAYTGWIAVALVGWARSR